MKDHFIFNNGGQCQVLRLTETEGGNNIVLEYVATFSDILEAVKFAMMKNKEVKS